MLLNIPIQSNEAYSVKDGSAALINMFNGASQSSTGSYPSEVFPSPGLKNFVDLHAASVIKGIRAGELAYFVYLDSTSVPSAHLVSVDINQNVIALGNLGTGITSVSMAKVGSNANSTLQILIATGRSGYLWNASTNTFSTVGSNFPTNCAYVTSSDNFFIALKPDSNQWSVSNLEDGTIWQALNFAETTTSGTKLIAAASVFQQLFLFNEETAEIWSATASQQFPFIAQQGNFINYGTGAPASVVTTSMGILWLSQNAAGQGIFVLASGGNNVQIVSTDALTTEINQYSTINDCVGIVYQEMGHEFVQFTFPSGGTTKVYDLMTKYWHEKKSYNVNALTIPAYTKHRANCCVFLNGLTLVGDYTSGKIFTLDRNTYIDDGSWAIPRQITTAPITWGDRYISIDSLELLVEPGQGLITGQGSNPLIGLEISRDGGFTFETKRIVSLGPIGQYKYRVRWNVLGHARSFVFRFTVSDPIKFVVLGLIGDTDIEPAYPPVNVMQKVYKDV